MKVYLKYGFIFDPASTWAHKFQFEQDLARFFSKNGLEAEIIETAEGQESIDILMITKGNLIPVDDEPVQFNSERLEEKLDAESKR
jgi:hypothetical protein